MLKVQSRIRLRNYIVVGNMGALSDAERTCQIKVTPNAGEGLFFLHKEIVTGYRYCNYKLLM